MADKHESDTAMIRVRALFEKSGLTLHDLGVKMGYPEGTARMSAWQFMKTSDPRISMLRRFATALEMTIEELVAAKIGRKKSV
jgi:transcriptional regulator with XRE-family HTH domain